LYLEDSAYTAGRTAPLTALTSLRRLRLLSANGMLPCLPALTWLEQLEVETSPEQLSGQVDAALPSLQHLTCLAVDCDDYQRIPPALAELPLLQRLCFTGIPAGGADLSLPQGPWLASIRWLGLPWQVLESAVSVLSNAPRLEYLCIFKPRFSGNLIIREAHPLWNFAATYPPLRCLGFCTFGALSQLMELPFVTNSIPTLASNRPELRLRYLSLSDIVHFEVLSELFDADARPQP